MSDKKLLELIYSDLQEVKKDVGNIRTQQAVHDEVVARHEQRSTSLQEFITVVKEESGKRLAVLEDDAKFFKNFVKFMTILGGLVLFVLKILPLLGLL